MIGLGNDWCLKEGCVDSGEEVEAQVPQCAASKVGSDKCHVCMEEIL